jgi:hypothetical protein
MQFGVVVFGLNFTLQREVSLLSHYLLFLSRGKFGRGDGRRRSKHMLICTEIMKVSNRLNIRKIKYPKFCLRKSSFLALHCQLPVQKAKAAAQKNPQHFPK